MIYPNRYLKLASAKNPSSDFIELNDLQGYLCTNFQTLGISRSLEFLSIKNRQFSVDNKPKFKNYNLTIQILSNYSEYEARYSDLIDFLDRNKKDGFRLYYRPYKDRPLRYCLCDIESSSRVEKMQPISLILTQNSLWLSEINERVTSQSEQQGNLFVFDKDDTDYYSISFSFDTETNEYNVAFYSNVESEAVIENKGYNEIPLNIKIEGKCINPSILLYKKGENEPIRETKVFATIDKGYNLEINSNILENGVWLVNTNTGEKTDYTDLVSSESSPYFYIENGNYVIKVVDEGNNVCKTYVNWQEEFSE